MRKFLFCALLLISAKNGFSQNHFRIDTLMLRVGYGGTYLYTTDAVIGRKTYNLDHVNFGLELISNKGIDLSLQLLSNGLLYEGNPFQRQFISYSLNVNYRPLRRWKSQPFIGGGISYPTTAVEKTTSKWGTIYHQVISVKGANGITRDVLAKWIQGEDGIVRLVSAYKA